jgi:hypothetical protein
MKYRRKVVKNIQRRQKKERKKPRNRKERKTSRQQARITFSNGFI